MREGTMIQTDQSMNKHTNEVKGTEKTIQPEEHDANLTQVQKQKLSRLQDTFLDVMKKEIVSVLHPYY